MAQYNPNYNNVNYNKQPNPSQRNVNGCDPERCKICSLNTVCPKSPFNIINSLAIENKEQIDIADIINNFNEKISSLINVINPIIAHIGTISDEIKKLSDSTTTNIDEIKKELSVMSEKIDEFDIEAINESSSNSNNSVAVYDANIVDNTAKNLIAKKTIFGNTKYVEEK